MLAFGYFTCLNVMKGDAAAGQKYLGFDVSNELGNLAVDRIIVCPSEISGVTFLHDG
jgi:hypothetical protein